MDQVALSEINPKLTERRDHVRAFDEFGDGDQLQYFRHLAEAAHGGIIERVVEQTGDGRRLGDLKAQLAHVEPGVADHADQEPLELEITEGLAGNVDRKRVDVLDGGFTARMCSLFYVY